MCTAGPKKGVGNDGSAGTTYRVPDTNERLGGSRATWIAEKKRDEMDNRRPDSGMLKEKLKRDGTEGGHGRVKRPARGLCKRSSFAGENSELSRK